MIDINMWGQFERMQLATSLSHSCISLSGMKHISFSVLIPTAVRHRIWEIKLDFSLHYKLIIFLFKCYIESGQENLNRKQNTINTRKKLIPELNRSQLIAITEIYFRRMRTVLLSPIRLIFQIVGTPRVPVKILYAVFMSVMGSRCPCSSSLLLKYLNGTERRIQIKSFLSSFYVFIWFTVGIHQHSKIESFGNSRRPLAHAL